jgi:signal transduction histidine kinase
MAEMVSQLLDLTQTRLAGGVPIARTPVDLVAVLNSVLEEIVIASPGVPFHRATPPRLMGEWDGARLAQVISNLVGNAVQHGDRSRPIVIGLEERDAAALLTVQIHGPAILGTCCRSSSTRSGAAPPGRPEGRRDSGSVSTSRARSCERTGGRLP